MASSKLAACKTLASTHHSNIYLPESTTPIATMGRYDGNAAVFLDYIYSVGISNIRVTDPTRGPGPTRSASGAVWPRNLRLLLLPESAL